MKIVYTDEQNQIINKICDELNSATKASSPTKITLGGFAGTGKTSIIKKISSRFPNFAICAYTGKATNVLKRKGLSKAQTIHSTIYDVNFDNNSITYSLKNQDCVDYDGFIVDESSMISREIANDIDYFGKPILYVGDHGQLPPVGDSFNLMQNPQYRLETIHRNAGQIAQFANHLRNNLPANTFVTENDQITILSKKTISMNDLVTVNQVICGFNKTRLALNQRIRQYLKLPPEPVTGDKVIVLKNNKLFGVFNGQQGVITNISNNSVSIKFEKGQLNNLPYNKDLFNQEKIDQEILNQMREYVVLDFAYAITCHKAQGDQFESIAVIEEPCRYWDNNRWNYTAASRAESKILWYR